MNDIILDRVPPIKKEPVRLPHIPPWGQPLGEMPKVGDPPRKHSPSVRNTFKTPVSFHEEIKSPITEEQNQEVNQERTDRQDETDRQQALINAEEPIVIKQRIPQEGVVSRALKLMGEEVPKEQRTQVLEERGKYQRISNPRLGVPSMWIDTTTGQRVKPPPNLPGFLLKE